MFFIDTAVEQSNNDYRALVYFNAYRLFLVFLFLGMIWFDQLPEPLGSQDRWMFAISVHIYFFMIMVSLFIIKTQYVPFVLQLSLHFLIDIICINLMMYASSGINSGFGMLMVVTVAACSLLSSYKLALFFAAITSLTVLSQEIYLDIFRYYPAPNYPHAGFLGITFFASALIACKLAGRLQASEALAIRQAEDIQNLATLNEHIVQNLRSGVIVVDKRRHLRLINEPGRKLLKKTDLMVGDHLSHVSLSVLKVLDEWEHSPSNDSLEMKDLGGALGINASIRRLGRTADSDIVIFLYDSTRMRLEAQGLKLASLGRLTASIAHEVRNPLGAISHASQLLSESNSIQAGDKRLTEIIHEHCLRVNQIIENVMSVSRMDAPNTQDIAINEWLEDFFTHYAALVNLKEDDIRYCVEPKDLLIRFDKSQLYQVMLNLLENAIRYSKPDMLFTIECTLNTETGDKLIDVSDSGPGIDSSVIEHLFEPFFTTENTGSGLGLYLAREICEINQARLSLHSSGPDGSCFRILFPSFNEPN